MNALEMLQHLADDKVKVIILRFTYEKTWPVKLEKDADGVKLEVTVEDECLDAAISIAFHKFYGIAEQGIPEFSGPLLTHQPPANDDTPF